MIDPLVYRSVLGHFPTGVTVITGLVDDHPVGFTVGSFTSVSLDPPLVGFLPMITSDRWAAIRSSGSFCVNVLGTHQNDLCWQFARSTVVEPFEGVDWDRTPITGSPRLAGALAWMDCAIDQVVDAGDHHFVMGRVQELAHTDTDEVDPLVFFRGKVGGFNQL
jgi:3-hydroxy-9,10-secoandrosta-1,3,5(10)-triene-9,17-dione monooxygenase reductase component